MMDIVSIDRLNFRYNSIEVLTDISLNISKGAYLGLVGPNGSGKTTLIKLILGLNRPSMGTVRLFGQEPFRFREWQRVGYLPQRRDTINPRFPATVREIVAMGLLPQKGVFKRFNKRDEQPINRVMDIMDIKGIEDRLIGELSGGQQQRVLIARAMVGMPELLILDEPTTALDPEMRERFFETLRSLNEDRDVTIIIVTHDIGTIGKYATRLLYLDKRAIFHGSFEEFCTSLDMERYFGRYSQHIICHRHDQ